MAGWIEGESTRMVISQKTRARINQFTAVYEYVQQMLGLLVWAYIVWVMLGVVLGVAQLITAGMRMLP